MARGAWILHTQQAKWTRQRFATFDTNTTYLQLCQKGQNWGASGGLQQKSCSFRTRDDRRPRARQVGACGLRFCTLHKRDTDITLVQKHRAARLFPWYAGPVKWNLFPSGTNSATLSLISAPFDGCGVGCAVSTPVAPIAKKTLASALRNMWNKLIFGDRQASSRPITPGAKSIGVASMPLFFL